MSAPANLVSVPMSADTARQLATAGKKADDWRTRRDQLIVKAHQEGASLREIARVVGMSNPGVLRVIRKGDILLVHNPDGSYSVAEVVDDAPSAPPEGIWEG